MTMEVYQSGRQASSIKRWRTWLRYRGSDIVHECRFLVDESALSLDDVPQGEREDSLISLIDQLDALRVSAERVQLLENWGAVECLGGDDVAETMVNYQVLDRDQSLRLLTLLDQCVAWSRPAAVGADSEIVVDGRHCQGDGIAWAREKAILKNWTAVVTTSHRFAAGVHSVDKPAQSLPVDVYFAVSTEDHPGFFRLLYEWEDVSESDFFERARLAFPRLVFAADTSFRKFQGAYRTLRPKVVDHLGRINDRFPEVYAAENGMPDEVSSRLGIQVSIEGNTRSSERLMRLRDVEFRGQVYRCEWHSKLEPNRNRIHFHVIDCMSETKILIGIFHEHLAT